MGVPTINIVMSFDSETVQSFLTSPTLASFEKSVGDNKKVFIFRDGPASNFLSLKHNFGMRGVTSKQAATPLLELEFVDPEATFEARLQAFIKPGVLPVKANVREWYMRQIRDNTDKMDKAVEDAEKQGLSIESAPWAHPSLFEPTNPEAVLGPDVEWDTLGSNEMGQTNGSNPTFRQYVKDQREIVSFYKQTIADLKRDMYAVDELKANQAYLNALMRNQGLLEMPVWITYGVGDDIKNWSKPMAFLQPVKAEYNFNGAGSRVLKLMYDPIGIHPDLIAGLSTHDMYGELGGSRVLRKGFSYRLFNREAAEWRIAELKKRYPGYKDRGSGSGDLENTFNIGLQGNASYENPFYAPTTGFNTELSNFPMPCLHDVITTTLHNFILNSTNYENVLVAFPNLDAALEYYEDQKYREGMTAADPRWDNTALAAFGVKWDGSREAVEAAGQLIAFKKTLEPLKIKFGQKFKQELGGTNLIQLFEELDVRRAAQSRGEGTTGGSTDLFGTGGGDEGPLPYNPGTVLNAMFNQYEATDMRAIISARGGHNGYTYLEVVNRVMMAVKQKALSYATSHTCPIDPVSYIETDVQMLEILHKAGLIPHRQKPCLIYGDKTFIDLVLYGRFLFSRELGGIGGYTGPDSDYEDALWHEFVGAKEETTGAMTFNINPIDVHKGLNNNYFRLLQESIEPTPWTGPFGEIGKDAGFANAFSAPEELGESENAFSNRFSNSPIFSLGTKNPNILNIEFDINNYWLQLINSYTFQPQLTHNSVSKVLTQLSSQKLNSVMTHPGLPMSLPTTIFGNHEPNHTWDPAGPHPGYVPTSTGEQAQLFYNIDQIPDWFRDFAKPYYAAKKGSEEAVELESWKTVIIEAGVVDIDDFAAAATGWYQKEGFLGGRTKEPIAMYNETQGKWASGPEQVIEIPYDPGDVYTQPTPMVGINNTFDLYVYMLWISLISYNNKIYRNSIEVEGGAPGGGVLSRLQKVQDSVQNQIVVAKIKTLPMFHLSNMQNTIERLALLYCVEPRVSTSVDDVKRSHTWFSGKYVILGFNHVISGKDAYSEFVLARDPKL